MSREGLRSALIDAICGIVPTRVQASPFTLHVEADGADQMEETTPAMRVFELAASGALEDTGQVHGDGASLVAETWALRVCYPASVEPGAADWQATIAEDAATITRTLRNPDVWAAEADTVNVSSRSDVEQLTERGGVSLRVLTIPIGVRYWP